MKLLRIVFLSLLCCSFDLKAAPSHILSFFFQKYPTLATRKAGSFDEQSYIDGVFKNDFNTGIFVTYFGYKAASDYNGQISFPRKHQKPEFSLLVCQEIEPELMAENTIYNWKVKTGAKFSFYNIERKEDVEAKLAFWSVEEKKLPTDMHIPLDTIVIHASPESIEIPTGITITSKSEQLILPTVYIKSSIELSENALAFLQSNDFFTSVQRAFKVDKDNTEARI